MTKINDTTQKWAAYSKRGSAEATYPPRSCMLTMYWKRDVPAE